jgi:hypothetical protein
MLAAIMLDSEPAMKSGLSGDKHAPRTMIATPPAPKCRARGAWPGQIKRTGDSRPSRNALSNAMHAATAIESPSQISHFREGVAFSRAIRLILPVIVTEHHQMT